MIKANLINKHSLNNTLKLITDDIFNYSKANCNGKYKLLVKIINRVNVLTFVYVYRNHFKYLTAMTICVKIN